MNNSNSFNNSLLKTNAIIQHNIDEITSERKKLMNDKITFIKRCQHEQNNLDKTKSDLEQERTAFNNVKATFEQERITFEQEKNTFNNAKSTFEQEKNAFNNAKSTFEQERIIFEQQTPQEKNSKLRHFSMTYKNKL